MEHFNVGYASRDFIDTENPLSFANENTVWPNDYPEIKSKKARTWGAVTATVTDFRANTPFTIDMRARVARLSYVAEVVGGGFEIRNSSDKRSDLAMQMQGFSFLPAGAPAVGYGSALSYIRHLVLDLCLDDLKLNEGQAGDFAALERMRLGFRDARLEQICRMFIDETLSPTTSGQMFINGLTTALVSRLIEIDDSVTVFQGGLAPWQMKRIMDYIMDHLADDISMEELASVVRLSRSYFCRTFKSTTGVTPHQFQLTARIERAKTIILRSNLPLAQIALDVGFSDQAHFTRVFRKAEGISPGQWRRSRQP